MDERRQDFELLQRFTRGGEQSAFAHVVQRHLDLVFATAIRKVDDIGAAQEVAQNVFIVLARKAWQFAPDDSLPAWLHKAALLECKSWLRGELGRRRREETAAELGTTMNSPENQPAFTALVPLLDEALLSLREKDRAALLLRYYESQSLRQVGAAFGISEDTAQKRVQSALEKLAQFFKRRGFRTATVAATAAALQQTAASASATLASTVVSAALQAAPPALIGLSGLIARMVSMSRVRTGAVCVVLTAVPLVWQLNARHLASEEAKRLHRQLLAAQQERAALEPGLESLRAISNRLDQSLVEARAAVNRAAESDRAFENWKRRIRGQLADTQYRWIEDSPFARIPKSALASLSKLSGSSPFMPPGVVEPYERELMGLTPSERQSVEETLHQHFTLVAARLAARIYETNSLLEGNLPKGVVAFREFVSPGLSDQAKQLADQMVADLRAIVGEERWPMVQATIQKTDGLPGRILNLGTKDSEGLQIFVGADNKVVATWGNGAVSAYHNAELSMFLPEDDPHRTQGADKFGGNLLSSALRQRAAAWLQEQAIDRIGKKEGP